METYRGRITLADGDEVDVDLELSDETIRLATENAEIGTWSRGDCEIIALGEGLFEIAVDGDHVVFVPFDEPAFVQVLNGSLAPSDHLVIDEESDPLDDLELAGDADVEDEGVARGDAEAAEPAIDGEIDALDDLESAGDADVEHEDVARGEADAPDADVTIEGGEDENDEIPVDDNGAETSFTPDDRALSSDDAGTSDLLASNHEQPGEDEVDAQTLVHVAGPDDPTTSRDAVEDEAVAAQMFSDEQAEIWGDVDPAGRVMSAGDDGDGHVVEAPEGSGDDDDEHPLGGTGIPAETEEDVHLSDGREESTTTDGGALPTGDVDLELLEAALEELGPVDDSGHPLVSGNDSPADTEVDDKPVPQSKGRFGGSSVERLASVVGSLKKQQPMTPADEALAQAEGSKEGQISDGIMASQRALRQTKKVSRFSPDTARRIGAGILLGIGIAVLVVLTPGAMEVMMRGSSDPGTTTAQSAPDTTVVDTTSPSTSEVAPSTTVGGDTATTSTTSTTDVAPSTTTTGAPPATQLVFDRPVEEFVQAWNGLATPIEGALAFVVVPPRGSFENEFYPYLSMEGIIDDSGALDEFTLVVDPTGPSDADFLAIQALGVAIRVVDPTTTGSGAAALLASLGLDVQSPQLAGIDSTIDVDGVRYSLQFDEELVLLRFSVAPATPTLP